MIDSEKAARRLLRAILEPQGYRVLEAKDAGSGMKQAVERKPDVIVLEIALPDGRGFEVIQMLREWSRTPVLVLSEKGGEDTKVAALDAGASDYLTKPFSSAELLARLRVLQRTVPNSPEGPFFIEGELVLDLATRKTKLRERQLLLTPKEEALFCMLARYGGLVVTHAHLLRAVWGVHSEAKIHDLRVLVGHLRKKLAPCAGEMLIRTEGNLGYSLSIHPQTDRGHDLE